MSNVPTTASSRVPATKLALVKFLEKLSGVGKAGVEVRYADHPERKKKAAWISGEVISELEVAGFKGPSRHRRHEDFTLTLFVEDQARKIQDAEEDCWSIARTIERAIAEDHQLGTTKEDGISWATVVRLEADSLDTSEGAVCRIEIEIRCRAELT